MPDLRKGEMREQYVSRCIPVVKNEGTAQSTKQAIAICSSMFERGKKK